MGDGIPGRRRSMCRGPAGRESTCAQGPSGEFSGAGARPEQGQEPGERAVAGQEGLCAQQAVNPGEGQS